MRKLILKNHFNFNLVKHMLRWHFNYHLRGRGFPVIAGVYITDGCNCRCMMCRIWENKRPSVLSRDVQERTIDVLARTGCYYYSVSGGEPTMVKDLPDRLTYASRKISYVHLVTNGLAMTSELARALGKSGIKEISISLDGTERFHNTIRGLPNAFARAWNAIDLIKTHAPAVKVVVNSILTPYNLESLQELERMLGHFPQIYQKYLPLSFHEFFRIQNVGHLEFEGEGASATDMEKFLRKARSNSRIVNSPIFLRKAALFFKNNQDVINEQKKCLYPYFGIEFDSKGYAYPCYTGLSFENGIPCGANLENYLKSREYLDQQEKLTGCTRCRGSMMLCYYEPRLNFPIHTLLYYAVHRD